MKKHVIVAPHADDEIIGCYSVLCTGKVRIVAFPFANSVAVDEARAAQTMFQFATELFEGAQNLLVLAQIAFRERGLIFFPDPVYELHPEHRVIGAMGEQILRRSYPNVVFYSTNMNAPYIRESHDVAGKQKALNACYIKKRSLWEYDHRYFLFEGQTRWLTDEAWHD